MGRPGKPTHSHGGVCIYSPAIPWPLVVRPCLCLFSNSTVSCSHKKLLTVVRTIDGLRNLLVFFISGFTGCRPGGHTIESVSNPPALGVLHHAVSLYFVYC